MLLQRCIDSGVVFHIDKARNNDLPGLPHGVCAMCQLAATAVRLLRCAATAATGWCSTLTGKQQLLSATHEKLSVINGCQVSGVQHRSGGSQLQCADGTSVEAAAVLDATGHALKLVEFDAKFDPGYQVPTCLISPSRSCKEP